ncbi:MAG: hypothetical protein COB67_02610 [SAR324 cluster bacterium]|uniref:Lipoprotein n=1 Tax=SAR324 cluster bacterium TaxID=2024889 RepID=A0A2A4TB39_9DELT|nr:MAG: hypothetical protein COB67_02610 [SAR324 cluster bacterium]
MKKRYLPLLLITTLSFIGCNGKTVQVENELKLTPVEYKVTGIQIIEGMTITGIVIDPSNITSYDKVLIKSENCLFTATPLIYNITNKIDLKIVHTLCEINGIEYESDNVKANIYENGYYGLEASEKETEEQFLISLKPGRFVKIVLQEGNFYPISRELNTLMLEELIGSPKK